MSPGVELKTVYEYFTENGIQSGLTADTPDLFRLNGREIRIVSGALHYFRVHPDLWRDRFRKYRAAGLNTVETYVPWNLHEPMKGYFDFGNGTNEFSAFLNLRNFVLMAQEEDLLVLFRPGPYICSEWDFGGLPSWLLRDSNMKIRTSYQPYLDHVTAYFDQLLPQVADLQFTNGGPIIAIQIENEYGSFSPIHKSYLEHIKNIYDRHGFNCLQFTSDGASNGAIGALPERGVLMTANFQSDPKGNLDKLRKHQPNRPTMVMEYWNGWFDHWFEKHNKIPVEDFAIWLDGIFNHSQTSVNFYMFHGGTNFGFMAGANKIPKEPFYASDVTSYDYDGILSESGDYTPKYYKAIELINKYEIPKLFRPDFPPKSPKVAYPSVILTHFLSFSDILEQIPPSAVSQSEILFPMELLDINEGNGQSYGYIAYQTTINFLQFTENKLMFDTPVRDFGIVLLDGEIVNNISDYWIHTTKTFDVKVKKLGLHQLTIFVENTARVNFGVAKDFIQHKGLTGKVHFNSELIKNFTIYAAEFKKDWIQGLKNWRSLTNNPDVKAPAIFKATFMLSDIPEDTFLDMSSWHKGIVFINGFNLGRYFKVGPQKTLYLPAPLLQLGENIIIVFEQLEHAREIQFSATPQLG